MKQIIPEKLKKGDEIRVIAPSRSLSVVWKPCFDEAVAFLEKEGFKVTFSRNSSKIEYADSASIQDRVDDIHEAFSDHNVKAILTSIGGFNVNQILEYLDYSLIKDHPKIICGYSDITALLCAIYAKTGLVTYHGPHFSTFGIDRSREYTLEYFKKCVMNQEQYAIEPFSAKGDLIAIQEGTASGTIIGGNLCTLNLLQGTEFMPELNDVVLFLEDDNIMGDYFEFEFERNLQSLLQVTGATIKGVVFGRLSEASQLTVDKLKQMVSTKKLLRNIPIIADADFGHIFPFFTFPIGGTVSMNVNGESICLTVETH